MSRALVDGPAFPLPDGEDQGMTLRDYFAAKAMVALIMEPTDLAFNWGKPELKGTSLYAYAAYKMADAMLAERLA